MQQLPDEVLIDRCVEEARPKLQHRPPIMVYGRWCTQPRDVGFFRFYDVTIPGDDVIKGYHYSGQVMSAQLLPASLQALLDSVNEITGANYNSILVNEYMNGLDTIGAHSDSEIGIDPSAGVTAISWGAVRNFRIRAKIDKSIVANIPTTPYSLMQMKGDFQALFTHEIPTERKVKGSRVSFTFRKFD